MSALRRAGAALLGFLIAGPLGLVLALYAIEVEELPPEAAKRARRAARRS